MKEILHIKNFGGLNDVTVEISQKYTLILGQQASGKSIIAKLLYFFKGITSFRYYPTSNLEDNIIEQVMSNRFYSLFPERFWPDGSFEITYSVDDKHFVVNRFADDISFIVPDSFKKILESFPGFYTAALDALTQTSSDAQNGMADFMAFIKARQQCMTNAKNAGYPVGEQLFVVAARSFYSEMTDRLTALIANNVTVEQLLLESYATITSAKKAAEMNIIDSDNKVAQMIHNILKADYRKEKDKEYLLHEDGRKIELQYASSGQQETFPLLMVLNYVMGISRMSGDPICLYIEEPEAHIFPSAQKLMVELISYISNSTNNIQVILTTHSPYVMSSFNNLIEADNIIKVDSSKQSKVESIVGKNVAISYDDVRSYMLKNGSAFSIMDKGDRLIDALELDAVSNEINITFEKLLAL